MMFRDYVRMVQEEYASRYAGPIPPMPALLREPWIRDYLRVMFPRTVVAVWRGWQTGVDPQVTMGLWTLTRPVPGHPAYSTVSTSTLKLLGYDVAEPRSDGAAARRMVYG